MKIIRVCRDHSLILCYAWELGKSAVIYLALWLVYLLPFKIFWPYLPNIAMMKYSQLGYKIKGVAGGKKGTTPSESGGRFE